MRPYAPYDSYALGALGGSRVAGFRVSAAALIARAEAAGMRLRLEGERVRFTAPAEPPPDLLADLRQHREAVRAALAARATPSREHRDAWGMSHAERVAALARLEAAEPVDAAPAPPEPPPPPALPWHAMPYGGERGRAFADARRQPGACPHCAGRRWWRRAGVDEPATCATCHPPPPGLAVESIAAPTPASTYTPEAPDDLRDGLLAGFHRHRAAVKP